VKAQKQLGVVGPENPQLKLAINDLEKAELEFSFASIYAPSNGFIESFNIDAGYYAQAGQALATLVSKHDMWIQADFRENNLSKMKLGDKVQFILDIAPGKIFEGTVRSIGFGVDSGNSVNRGGLPTIGNSSSWLRDPQRFPVSISIADQEAQELSRAGGQADVLVFTGDHSFLNKLARYRIWINSWLSYVR
jgi:multidrug resistance efflux pump